MQRNQREGQLKYVRRLGIQCDDLWDTARYGYELVPLKYPQFAGWETYITLDEAGMRRRDAPDILFILDLLGWSTPRFIRSLQTIRSLRHSKYRWTTVKTALSRKQFKDTWTIEQFYKGRDISEKEYLRLTPYYQTYFHYNKYESERYSWRHDKVYSLTWDKFPSYELVYKVKNSYWTHVKVYDTQAQSDYTRLYARLWNGNLRNDCQAVLGYNRHRDSYTKSIQCAWKTACHRFKLQYNTLGLSEWYEDEEYITKACKCYKRNAYGYD